MNINKNNLDFSNELLIEQLLTTDKTSVHKTTLTLSIVGAGGKTHLAYWLADFFKQLGHSVCLTSSTKMYLPESDRFDKLLTLSEYRDKSPEQLNPQPSITFLYKEQLQKGNSTDPVKVKGLSASTLKEIQHSLLFDVLIVEADGAKRLPIKVPAKHEPCLAPDSTIVIGVTGAEAIFSKANSVNIHRWTQFSALTACNEGMKINHNALKALLEDPHGMFKDASDDAVKIWVINKCDLHADKQPVLTLAESLLTELPLLNSIWLTQLNSSSAIKNVLVNL